MLSYRLFLTGWLCALLAAAPAAAQTLPPAPPTDLSGAALREWLKANWFDGLHTTLSYSAARQQMFGFIDPDSTGRVRCAYTGFEQAGGFVTFPDPINTEHVVPQSFFGQDLPMRSDLHHLFPTHQNVNSARGNLPLREVPDAQTDQWYTSDGSTLTTTGNVPSANIDLYSERDVSVAFEPREDVKGNVARAVFYFYTVYPTQGGTIAQVGDVEELYAWHQADPPDAVEQQRNARVAQQQGNYNPYVASPDLVARAWGLPVSLSASAAATLVLWPNPTAGTLYFSASTLSEAVAEVYDAHGRLLRTYPLAPGQARQTVDVADLPGGLYVLRLRGAPYAPRRFVVD